MIRRRIIFIELLAIMLVACNGNGPKADAYGNFETDEIMVSAEATGKILWLSVVEGETIDSGIVVGLIDTSQIALRRKQLSAQVKAVSSRLPSISAQAEVQHEQIRVLEVDRNRLSNMLVDGAATQKQLDDVDGRISLARKQIEAIETQRISISAEIDVLKTQLAQVEDQLSKCKIVNPTAGTILARFAQQGEVAPMGKPLYKLADMNYLYLKVFVTGEQLHRFALGKKVKILIDGTNEQMIEKEGVVSWVSSNAEFTPKIIQTREERVKMVYAVKVRVKNDGMLKIGMPGEAYVNE